MENIEFSGRNFEITDAIRAHTREKLENALEGINHEEGIKVILKVENYRHIAEMVVPVKKKTFVVEEETEDMYSAIGLSAKTLKRTLRKHKDKIVSQRRKSQKKKADIQYSVDETPEEGDEKKIIKTQNAEVKPMSPDEAALQLETSDEHFMVFRNANTRKVNVMYRRNDGNFGWIDPD